MNDDAKELSLTHEQAIVIFDSVNMMKAEAKTTLDDNENIIAPLKREAEATIDVCDIVINMISVEFNFDVEED